MSDLTLSILLCRALRSANIDLWEEATHTFGADVVSGFCRRYKLLPFIPIESKEIARKFANIKAEITALRMATEEVNRLQIEAVSAWFHNSGISSSRVCLLKGHALLNTILKESPWRTCSDVDCLLREEDLLALCRNKDVVDFSSSLPCRFHSEIVWSPKNLLQSSPLGRRDLVSKKAAIDFHWAPRYLLQGGYVTCNQEMIFSRSRAVSPGGLEFCVPDPLDLYASMFIHAVDAWDPHLKNVIDLGHLLPSGDLKLPVLELANDTSLVKHDTYLQSYVELLHYLYRTDCSPKDFPESLKDLLKSILNQKPRQDTAPLRNEAYLPVRSFQGLSLRDRIRVYLGYALPDEGFYRHWRPEVRYPYLYHPLFTLRNVLLRILRIRK